MRKTLDDYSDMEKLALRETAKEVLATRNYADFFKLVSADDIVLYPHIRYVCEKIQKIADGEQHKYIVEMPPQHGKSTVITKTFPSYYLMKNPDARVMLVAYAENLYSSFTSANRRVFQEWGGRLFGLHTSKDTSQEFHIADHEGQLYATSITGGASGRPAELLIVDDPVKNYSEAVSPTKKNTTWNEWLTTFSPRLQKNSSAIVIMTRWQIDDLAGRLLQHQGDEWEEIKFPAIATDDNDLLGRKTGEALCPELHPLADLQAQEKLMGKQKFTAEYQQSPTIESGNVFKREWVKYYVPDCETMIRLGLTEKDVKILPRIFDYKAQSWDATFKSKENNDFVAGQVWFERDKEYYLMDWVHERMTFTETLKAIRQISTKYPDVTAKYIEDKANGSAIIDTLKREINGIIAVEPEGGKEVRASAVSPLWEAGNVYVPHPYWKPSVEDMLEELFAFPNGQHDDYVDAMTQALNRMNNTTQTVYNF